VAGCSLRAFSIALRPSVWDREIARLGVLALGALAAEPLYVLVDTAIVGHLGRPQLAALGISAVVLSFAFANFNFLTYGTTAHVARAHGAGQRSAAAAVGGQAFTLSLALGVLLTAAVIAAAPVIAGWMGATGGTRDLTVTYLRIAALGLPSAFLALAGQGYFRGVSDLRTPLVIVVAGNAANVALTPVFVYGFGWGLAGSAWATALAQTGMGAWFAVALLRGACLRLRPRREPMRRLLTIGRHIFVRTTSLQVALVAAGAVAARFGDASIGAHQIAFQLWIFVALILDAVAIAAQVIVGRLLGSGDGDGAFVAGLRVIVISVVLALGFAALVLVTAPWLPRVFTGDALVIERAQAVWPLFAFALPMSAAVYALDGILIGAGDSRYLMWAMLLSSLFGTALAVAALPLGLGLVGVWAAIVVMNGVRLATLAWRFGSRRWAVVGWT
jgi:putative MATE family efflux protein